MTEHVIIDAAQRFPKKAAPSAAPLTLKTLPFVSPEWKNDYWPESMWTDVPTGDYKADRERGKRFAKLTLDALLADPQGGDDRGDGRARAVIFEKMIEDCARRRAKGGKRSRQLPIAIIGYLEVLANRIVCICKSQRDGSPAAWHHRKGAG